MIYTFVVNASEVSQQRQEEKEKKKQTQSVDVFYYVTKPKKRGLS